MSDLCLPSPPYAFVLSTALCFISNLLDDQLLCSLFNRDNETCFHITCFLLLLISGRSTMYLLFLFVHILYMFVFVLCLIITTVKMTKCTWQSRCEIAPLCLPSSICFTPRLPHKCHLLSTYSATMYFWFVFVFYCNNYLCFFIATSNALCLCPSICLSQAIVLEADMVMLLLKFKSPVRRLLFIPVAQDPSSPFVFLRDAISHFQRFFNTSRKILFLFYFCNKRTQRKKEKRLFCTPKKKEI